ncbi:MAG: hypothetical protein F6K31_06235 [Symploca sp. SIO2G7]|nr:hypothetical protein [Symploca sp. SIO2G7]
MVVDCCLLTVGCCLLPVACCLLPIGDKSKACAFCQPPYMEFEHSPTPYHHVTASPRHRVS